VEIKNNIKEVRKQKGLTQQYLADYLNLSQAAVAKIENNISNFPSIDIAFKIATALQTNVYELFGFENSSNNGEDIIQLKKGIEEEVKQTYKKKLALLVYSIYSPEQLNIEKSIKNEEKKEIVDHELILKLKDKLDFYENSRLLILYHLRQLELLSFDEFNDWLTKLEKLTDENPELFK